MSGYRVVVFVDALVPVECTDDIVQEVEHAIRLYSEDQPLVEITLSSVTPIEEVA